MAVLLAAIIAALVPMVLLAVLGLFSLMIDASAGYLSMESVVMVAVVVTLVAGATVLLLGVPAFLLLRRWRHDSWWTMALAGALLGSLLALWMGWPNMPGYTLRENWHGQLVYIYLNGEPTRYAWFKLAETTGAYALLGMATALVFYAVWRWLAVPGHSDNQN